ncbi:ribokinase [Agromyces bauzanensis]
MTRHHNREQPRVVVVGSANVDEIVEVPRHPGAGETILGGELRRMPGGKGANQAVAAARAGGTRTCFIGAVGEDEAGGILLSSLRNADVDTALVRREPGATGTALITVSPDGENAIVVAPGANRAVRIGADEAAEIARAGALLAQLEIPLEAIADAADARGDGWRMILNAAPSAPLPDALWDRIDVLVVNEHEAADLAPDAVSMGTVEALVERLLDRVPAVVVTLGADGCLVAERSDTGVQTSRVAGLAVHAVDTTGAGDTFCGVFAARIAAGADLLTAALAGTAAGALAVTRIGAQDSVPSARELEGFIDSHLTAGGLR